MSDNIKNILQSTLEKERDNYKKEFTRQGHNLSGKTADSFEINIRDSGATVVARVFVSEVAIYQDKGIKPERIPYRQGSGAKNSKYIDGLIRFWKLRKGLDDKEAKSAAFATARKHKQEGLHTVASRRFSSTGERINSLSNQFKTIDQQLEKEFDDLVIDNFLK